MRYILLVGLLIQCCNVVAQQKIFSTSLSERVQFLVSQGLENDSLDVIVVTNSKQSQDSLHGRILYSYPASNAFLVRTTAASVSRFTSGFMDIAHPAKVELTTGSLDLATNFVNLVHD